MLQTRKKALSLQLLTKHQERIRGMIANISKYKPTYHLNKSYQPYHAQKMEEQRQEQADKLFEENMKLIYRIETTGPKVQTKKFPPVVTNTRRLKTLEVKRKKSLSPPNKPVTKDVYRNEDEIFQENIKIITNIQCTGPKVECWRPKKLQSLYLQRKQNQQAQERKILQKFKDIEKEFRLLHRMSSTKSLLKSSPRTTIKTVPINRDNSTKSIQSIQYKTTR